MINTSVIAPVFLNIFNPVHERVGEPGRDVFFDNTLRTNRLGIYLQDQIALAENLKLVRGLRYDMLEQALRERPSFLSRNGSNRSQPPDALTPRVGIVYQPIPALSLFASYARSFSPNTEPTVASEFLEPEEGSGYDIGHC